MSANTVIAASEAKAKFSELLDRVQSGESFSITLHGEEAAQRAEEDFDVKFRKHEAPTDMPEFDATNLDLVSALVQSGFAPSGRGEAIA